MNNMTKELTHSEKLIALTDKIHELSGLPWCVCSGVPAKTGPRPLYAHDILRALGKKLLYGTYVIDSNGFLFSRTCNGECMDDCKRIEFDLSLPLVQQSESTVADLYKLFFE